MSLFFTKFVKLDPDPHSFYLLDPDLHSFYLLDPDPHSFYLLDPDPQKMNANPQPWSQIKCLQTCTTSWLELTALRNMRKASLHPELFLTNPGIIEPQQYFYFYFLDGYV